MNRRLTAAALVAVVTVVGIPARLLPEPRPVAAPAPILVGINETNLAWQPPARRKDVLGAIAAAGLDVVRLTWRRPAEVSWELFAEARRNGLSILLDLSAVDDATARPGTSPRSGNAVLRPIRGLSDFDPAAFERELAAIGEGIRTQRPTIVAIEFANEANWAGFNGDLPLPTPGVVWDRVEAMPEPVRSRFRAGTATYLEAVRILRRWRATIPEIATVPIIVGGLADVEPGFVASSGGSLVAIDGALDHLREIGLIDLVDGVGLHVYRAFMPEMVDRPERVRAAAADLLAVCGSARMLGKPCWITEFGSAWWPAERCDDGAAERIRANDALFEEIVARRPAIAAAIYYNWSQSPDRAIFRCGHATAVVDDLAAWTRRLGRGNGGTPK